MKINSLLSKFLIISLSTPLLSVAQISFTNQNTSLHSSSGTLGSNGSQRSGNVLAIVDVNSDGYDDIIKFRGNQYLEIEYQQAGGTFDYYAIGSFSQANLWSVCLSDVDHNGYKDILLGNGSQAYLAKLNSTGTGILGSIIALPNGAIFCQNANFMDVNNDGWEDIFVCNDVNESRIWVNDGTGNFPAEQADGVINFDVHAGTSAPNDESGNYSSVWTDFDNDGDVDFYITHCRQSYGPGDIRRTNILFENNGDGTYFENAAAHNMASNDQDWVSSFGDIDNDGDFDLLMVKHDVISRYYINDGSGNFTISPNTIAFGSMPMQSMFEDFDNDGFVDMFISGDNDHRLYHNNGNGTFSDVTPSNLNIGKNILSFVCGDLNHDGFIDLYTSYGTTYNNPSTSYDDIYWKNSTSNSNHFITLNLQAVNSNAGALGARAFIYGSWGTQTREVRAGESYGTISSSQLHFGLGSAASIDSVVVNWPSGQHTVIVNPGPDEFLNVPEQTPCTLSGAGISASGPLTICSGDSVILSADVTGTGSGYSYLWSTGDTTSSITADTSGSYAVTVTESANCQSASPSVDVVVNPNETPVITALSDTSVCNGDSVLLSCSPAASYLWSTGDTTQSIYAMSSDIYSANIQGLCQNWTSNTIEVMIYSSPDPFANDTTITAGNAVNIQANGNSISWYSDASASTLIGSGNSYNTGVLTNDTTFYLQDSYFYEGSSGTAGPVYHVGTSLYSASTTNAYLIFDVNKTSVLRSVKVYSDLAGTRKIELRNSSGGTIKDTNIYVPADTSILQLNFHLSPGISYQLGTNTGVNNSNFGFASPRFMRTSDPSVNYPYVFVDGPDTIVSINASSQTGSLYFYFYDWQIDKTPTTCTSGIVPVHVTVNPETGLSKNALASGIRIYPNPSHDILNIKLPEGPDGATIKVLDMLGKEVINSSFNGNAAQMNVGGLQAGAYEISILSGDKMYHSRFVVQ